MKKQKKENVVGNNVIANSTVAADGSFTVDIVDMGNLTAGKYNVTVIGVDTVNFTFVDNEFADKVIVDVVFLK